MTFEQICTLFTMKEPFYGIILSSMRREASNNISTIGVGRSGNCFVLHYNPDFLNRFNTDTVLEILKHEVLHVSFNHFSLWTTQNVSQQEHDKRNIAEDLEINSYLNEEKLLPANPCLPKKYGFEDRLGTMTYYTLLSDGDKFISGNGDGGISRGTSTLYGVVIDDHSQWPHEDKETQEVIKDEVESLLKYAEEETIKSCGIIPAEMEIRLKAIKAKKVKPICDWKKYVRRYLGNSVTETRKRSRMKLSKRFPDAFGSKHQRKGKVLVGIDTSGSINMKEYLEFFSQVNTMKSSVDVHVVECDAKIQYEYDYTGVPPKKVHGGGGTNFQPVIDLFLEHRKEYDSLIYYTDGFASIPKNTPKETLWVISSAGDHNTRKYKINGATAVFIPNSNNK